MLIVFITQGRGRVAPKREDGMGSSAADRGVASLTGKLNDLHIAPDGISIFMWPPLIVKIRYLWPVSVFCVPGIEPGGLHFDILASVKQSALR